MAAQPKLTALPTRTNRVVWFEIPATNIDRARAFYSAIFGEDVPAPAPFGNGVLSVLPYQKPHVGGCVMQSADLKPSSEGVVIYLNADPSLGVVLSRVESAGGKIVEPATAIPDMGFYAKILDTEGNLVGLHAMA